MATSSNVSNVTDIVHGHGDAPSASSIPNLIELILCSLTIALATGYVTLILRRPTIRKNILNWFTINICIATVLFCSIIPFSERKGLANRKCLYVRPTNQKAAFLNQRPTPDFGCKGKWG